MRDVLYRGDFPLLGKEFHLHLSPRKSAGVPGGTTGSVISKYSLKNSTISSAESNKQEPGTESLHVAQSYTFASLPRAKISNFAGIFSKQSLLPFYALLSVLFCTR